MESKRLTIPVRLAVLSFRRPIAVLVFWLAVGAASAFGIVRIEIDTATSSFLDRTTGEWATYQRSLLRHGADEMLVVALEYDESWSESALLAVDELSRKIQSISGVQRVDSLSTVPLIRSVDGVLYTNSGLEDGVPVGLEEVREFKRLVENDRIASNSLVSPDGRIFAINVLVDEDVDRDPAPVVAAVERLIVGHPARVSGVPIFRTRVNSRTSSELSVFVPATLIMLALSLVAYMRHWSAVAAPLAVGVVSAFAVLGAMGYSGVELSLSTMILPTVVLALGCAYSMHVVAAELGEESLTSIADPVALSGATTTLGFLAMATVPIEAITELATFGAFGVAVSTAAALSIGPAIKKYSGSEPRQTSLARWVTTQLAQYSIHIATRFRGVVIAVWIVAFLAGAVGLANLSIATDIILWFPEDGEIREDFEHVRDSLSGITPVNILIESRTEDSPDVSALESLRLIDSLSEDLASHPDVGKSLSIGDPLRLLMAAFSSSGDAVLPATDAAVEQSLLLLSGMTRLDDVLHPDRRSSNIVLRLNTNSSDDIVSLRQWVDDWWSEHGDKRFRVSTTGVMYEFARAEQSIATGQAQGLGIAIVLVGAILLLVLRDLRMAAIGMAANVVPIAVGFGSLGLAGMPLDAATACLGSMALGIAVDDSIHLVSGVRSARDNNSLPDAIASSISKVILPLVMTTSAITLGFLCLGLSEFTLIRNMGLVTAYIVSICLAADLTLLPALLGRRGNRG